ncbi:MULTISPECIES: hypothetical protein [unclassified Bacillus (in: firmicutes)]|uniref:hypothetical protein n=1 Tax=unclassified Bacillus (in: firmicutes) TaxID=185979 RepID=UPI00159708E6|nr:MULTISPECIES: hypothetical protein [unclassified Bacillus (in: firmicutes)]
MEIVSRSHRALKRSKHLTGRDEIMMSIYFADKELYDKYHRKIPGRIRDSVQSA